MSKLRIGIVGLGANTRLRHVPGLRACQDVEIVGVCNRTAETTQAVAAEFDIPKTYSHWEQLVDDNDVDAVVIGTWPYLHAPITVAGLARGKHVLTEARMARNLAEAREMHAASVAHPELVVQIVPSPFGLRADRVVRRLIADGFLGELREAVVLGVNAALADPASPRHWRQIAEFNGLNTLAMGILHETLTRWIADPTHVVAQAHTYTRIRTDTATGVEEPVESPDRLCILTEISGGGCGTYHLNGALHFGPGMQIHLYGSEGTLKYELAPEDRLWGAKRGDQQLTEIPVRAEEAGRWRVEEEFVAAIRGEGTVEFTDFETGLRYMKFTEAVARSVSEQRTVALDELS